MHAAPAVAVRAAGGRAWHAVQALLPALAAGVACAWVLLLLGHPPAPAAAAALVAGAVAWLRARPRAVDLVWNGQHWTGDGAACSVQVMVDLGGWLLLRLHPDGAGRGRWLACSSAEAGPAWHAFRTAVYSRPSPPTPRVLPAERAAD